MFAVVAEEEEEEEATVCDAEGRLSLCDDGEEEAVADAEVVALGKTGGRG